MWVGNLDGFHLHWVKHIFHIHWKVGFKRKWRQVAGAIDPNYVQVHFLVVSSKALNQQERLWLLSLFFLFLFFGHFVQESQSPPSDLLGIILSLLPPPSSWSMSSSGSTSKGVTWSLRHCGDSRRRFCRGGSLLRSAGTFRCNLSSTWSCSRRGCRGNGARCRVFGFMPTCLNWVYSRSFYWLGSVWGNTCWDRSSLRCACCCGFQGTCAGRFGSCRASVHVHTHRKSLTQLLLLRTIQFQQRQSNIALNKGSYLMAHQLNTSSLTAFSASSLYLCSSSLSCIASLPPHPVSAPPLLTAPPRLAPRPAPPSRLRAIAFCISSSSDTSGAGAGCWC